MTTEDIKITADLLAKGVMEVAESETSLLGQEYFEEYYRDGEWIVSFVDVIKEDLLPMAQKKHISLFQAMNDFANGCEDQKLMLYARVQNTCDLIHTIPRSITRMLVTCIHIQNNHAHRQHLTLKLKLN